MKSRKETSLGEKPEESLGNLINHNSMGSRHVNSFVNIRIDLLWYIVVTEATSHLLMSPLKAAADLNTVSK